MSEPVLCRSMCQNMENFVQLWRGQERVSVSFGDQPNGTVRKMVNVKDRVFLATTTCNLYHGQVVEDEGKGPALTFKRAQFYAVDVAANDEHLFIVGGEGRVLKVIPEDLRVIDTIVLEEEVKYCTHGYKRENETIKVRAIAVNNTSTLMVTECGQLWASGDQPQINVKSQELKKVIFFDGKIVTQVACGSNFWVVLVNKIAKVTKEDTDSENDIEDVVFVKSCPQCLNNALSSPVSVTSSDTCPIGLDAQPLSEDRSTNSLGGISNSSSKDNPNEDKVTNFTTVNGEGKKNSMVINSIEETARQFLTRQLSWVSSYSTQKDQMSNDTTDNPTRLIKQNVSNMANLVYEGVKTVGDKVATLSRHVSGSSDIIEIRDDASDTLKEPVNGKSKRTAGSLVHSLRCEEFPWSSSAGSSEHELSQHGLNERINLLVYSGYNLLSTEIWTWGDIKFGQLGIGDLIARTKPCEVTKLNHLGIRKIACGSFHTLALTLDGRIYAWGKNNFSQVTPTLRVDASAPQLFSTCSIVQLSNSERSIDIGVGSDHSLIMTHEGIISAGKYSKQGDVTQLDILHKSESSLKHVFGSGPFSCCTMTNDLANDVSTDLIEEQTFLEEMLIVYQNLIRPFQKKGGATKESNVYETLCRCYTELMNVTALNVASLWDYLNHVVEAYEVTIVSNVQECTHIYRNYLTAVCDAISLGGFSHVARLVEVPLVLTNLGITKIKDDNKPSNELIVSAVLKHPLERLNRCTALISNLIKCNGPNLGIERLQEALSKWELVCDEQMTRRMEAEATKQFWESSGKVVEHLRSPERRLIRESKTYPLSILNSSRRFSSHWFILLSDVFIHVCGTCYTSHPLPLLWVELLPDSDTLQNALSITVPQDTFVLYTPAATDRSEWFHALQSAIKNSLIRHISHAPAVRTGSFSFTKHPLYKDAVYNGQWLNGKPHGTGKLEWSDYRLYIGDFYKGVISGYGTMEIHSKGVYTGQWQDGQQNGYGCFNYVNGDVYDGYFQDGLPHGHGTKKEGYFVSSAASIYIGEWCAGVKQGYGVMDDIKTGEKYLGSWHNNLKHGNGLIITQDGIYYEGNFTQDVFTGHGVMVFNDGTFFEGEFKSTGVFGGKGLLTFSNFERLEGIFNGAWDEGVKVTATLHLNNKGSNSASNSTLPESFGKLCVPPSQKWKAIFRQCYQQLGVPEPGSKNSSFDKSSDTSKIWQNVAVIITKSQQKKKNIVNGSMKKDRPIDDSDQLNTIPCIGIESLNLASYEQIHKYLEKAFDSPHHPLGTLITSLATVYTASYGGVRDHALLLSHAVEELRSINSRIYEIVRLFFPALPDNVDECIFEVNDESDDQVVSATAILHPIVLPRVYSALFILYALHNEKKDEEYKTRLIKWSKQSDLTLMAFLHRSDKTSGKVAEDAFKLMEGQLQIAEAIDTLQQLKTTFSPRDKLMVIKKTVNQLSLTIKNRLGHHCSADSLLALFQFVVIRARVLQLGAEIHFIQDFKEPNLNRGQFEYLFTTLKICYEQILMETMDD